MVILGFNSVSAADSSDIVEDSCSDLEIISDSESSSDLISEEGLSQSDSNANLEEEDSGLLNIDSDSIYVSKDGNDDNDGSRFRD